jgi:hypothetical protein
MTAVTPAQTGGLVAQAYVLIKEGANLGQAMGILFMTFLSSLVFYLLVSLALWGLALSDAISGVEICRPFLVAVGLFGALTGVAIATLVFPAARAAPSRGLRGQAANTEWPNPTPPSGPFLLRR